MSLLNSTEKSILKTLFFGKAIQTTTSDIINNDNTISGMTVISAPAGATVPFTVSAPVPDFTFASQVYQLQLTVLSNSAVQIDSNDCGEAIGVTS
jgi:hypothetical protein